MPDVLWDAVDSSVAEYRGEALAANLLGLPFLARTGAPTPRVIFDCHPSEGVSKNRSQTPIIHRFYFF